MKNINIEHSLYPYQESDLELVLEKFKTNRKILLNCPTGYGKTVVMAFFCKWYIHNHKRKCVALFNRSELVDQAYETFTTFGLKCEKVISGKKKINHDVDVYLCMEQTLDNKLSKDENFLSDFGAVLIDEAHYQNFTKHIKYFSDKLILGVTATCIINERETFYVCDRCNTEHEENTLCCGIETMEWSRQRTMSMYYDDIVVGTSIQDLIDFGQLVPIYNVVIPSADLSNLKTDASGEFTTKSENEVFGAENAVFDVLANYKRYCLGKKTIIFTPSSKVNLKVYEEFKEAGINCKFYDSVNKCEPRADVIKWFKESDDGCLINSNVFIAGFDNKEVEWVILHRAFSSLSSYIQSVGRGGRSSKSIYKPNFGMLDLGGNYERFNSWSDPIDWERIFWEGLKPPKAKVEQLELLVECDNCSGLTNRRLLECEVCGYERPRPKKKEKEMVDAIAKPIEPPKPPNATKIIEYVKFKGGDESMARKIFYQQMIDLFRFNQISREIFEKSLKSGELDKKIEKYARPFYFAVMRSDLSSGVNVKLMTFIKKVKEKICKYYNS